MAAAAAGLGLGFAKMHLHFVSATRCILEKCTNFCSFSRRSRMSQAGRRAARGGSHVESEAVTERFTSVVVHLQLLTV